MASGVIAGNRIEFLGAGGPKMESAGLKKLVDFEALPVSGFGDVLPRYFTLRKNFDVLKKALENPLCKGLVAIDYPGFNMKLTAVANRLDKPVLYVAPPQAWAWKPKRAQKLSHPKNLLAVFFEFEKSPYFKAGCKIIHLEHPLVNAIDQESAGEESRLNKKERILIFPGSRKGQTLRNLPLFLEIANNVFPSVELVVVASRAEIKNAVESYLQRHRCKTSNLQVMESPRKASERLRFFRDSSLALSVPGTVTLELSLAGCNTVVCAKPDFLTYLMGKLLLKTPWLSLPNLILGKALFSEYILSGSAIKKKKAIQKSLLENFKTPLQKKDVEELRKSLRRGLQAEQLMSEFLAQFLQG